MSRERAKTFADRLPDVVPRVEEDISHLSDEMADLLYPGRRPRPLRMGVVFDAFAGEGYPRAVELAKRSPVYAELREGSVLRHRAEFEPAEARVLRELYAIVGELRSTDVLVDGRRPPYGRELWLPLFWIFI
ncbi:MAG TPA: hypothetical protein VFM88_10725 [Vicinamibacteria bacterium]|nr:hypothetical protein [Vicinamibacteria bacterium]